VTLSFDRRVVPEEVIVLLRACQQRVPFHLGGGAALDGIHLRHRLSKDADLFLHDSPLELGLIHDSVPDFEAATQPIEGIVVESLADLRANKLSCILSRAEPRDLVDLMFLDRAGFPPRATRTHSASK
jgi:hypothetical protein